MSSPLKDHDGGASASEFDTSQRIGPYRLTRKLGQGGMGAVFEAVIERPGGFRKSVALKLLPQGAHESMLQRSFLNEAVTGAAFNHPNIVQVLDCGTWCEPGSGEAFWYIAMEHVEGLTFSELIALAHRTGNSIPLPIVLELLIPVCDALAYAWLDARGSDGRPVRLIHRDIKPSNLMVSQHGQVKLLDLGVARASTNPLPTVVQMVKGTLAYMSPEQLCNRALDCRTDIFSLGLVLYELVMGKPLYVGRGDELRKRVAGGDVDACLDELEQRAPTLAPVLRRALAATPEARFSSPRDFVQALRALRTQHPARPSLLEFLEGCLPETRVTEVSQRVREPTELELEDTMGTESTPRSLPVAPTSPGAGVARPGRAVDTPQRESREGDVTVQLQRVGEGQRTEQAPGAAGNDRGARMSVLWFMGVGALLALIVLIVARVVR